MVQILRAKERCFARLSSFIPIILIMKEHQRSLRGSPFLFIPFLLLRTRGRKQGGRGLGQAQGPWTNRCTDQTNIDMKEFCEGRIWRFEGGRHPFLFIPF